MKKILLFAVMLLLVTSCCSYYVNYDYDNYYKITYKNTTYTNNLYTGHGIEFPDDSKSIFACVEVEILNLTDRVLPFGGSRSFLKDGCTYYSSSFEETIYIHPHGRSSYIFVFDIPIREMKNDFILIYNNVSIYLWRNYEIY